MRDRRLNIGLLVILTMLVGSLASAKPRRGKVPTLLAKGDQVAKRGDRLKAKGAKKAAMAKYKRALRLYRQAITLDPNPKVYFPIAITEQKLGLHLDSMRHYQQLLAESPDLSEKVNARVNLSMEELKKHLAALDLKIDPAGVQITVDGEVIGTSPLDTPYYMEPGAHTIELALEGHETTTEKLDLSAGDVDSRTISLTKTKAQPKKARRRKKVRPAPPALDKIDDSYFLLDAEGKPRKEFFAVRRSSPIVIDGRLDEEAWSQAIPFSDWLEVAPTYGKAPVYTEVKIVYDDEAIYLGYKMQKTAKNEPIGVVRDFDNSAMFGTDDVLSQAFALPEGTNSVVLAGVNGSNTQWTAMVDSIGKVNRGYTQLFKSAVSKNDDYWYIETRIAWKDLPLGPARGEERLILFAVKRFHPNRGAQYMSQHAPQQVRGTNPSFYGVIRGLRGVKVSRRLIAVPYASIRSSRDSGRLRIISRAGLDITSRISAGLNLELTLLTDFSDTRPDEAIVNLSRFPLFREEFRPFFQSGVDAFKFGTEGVTQVFYSRKIGIAPNGVERPILGGLKLFGKQGPISLGVLSVLTAQPPTIDGQLTAEGPQLHNVISARTGIGDAFRIGGIATANVLKDSRDAYSSGVDLEFRKGRAEALAFVAGTRNEPGVGKSNLAYSARATYSGDMIRPKAVFRTVGSEFFPALGFVARRDLSLAGGEVALVKNMNSALKQISLTPFGESFYNEDFSNFLGYSTGARLSLLSSFWQLSVTGRYQEDEKPEFRTLGGKALIPAGVYRGPVLIAALSHNFHFPRFRLTYMHNGSFNGGTSDTIWLTLNHNYKSLVTFSANATLGTATVPVLPEREDFVAINASLRYTPTGRLTFQAVGQYDQLRDSWLARANAFWIWNPYTRVILQYDNTRLNSDPDDRNRGHQVVLKASKSFAL